MKPGLAEPGRGSLSICVASARSLNRTKSSGDIFDLHTAEMINNCTLKLIKPARNRNRSYEC